MGYDYYVILESQCKLWAICLWRPIDPNLEPGELTHRKASCVVARCKEAKNMSREEHTSFWVANTAEKVCLWARVCCLPDGYLKRLDEKRSNGALPYGDLGVKIAIHRLTRAESSLMQKSLTHFSSGLEFDLCDVLTRYCYISIKSILSVMCCPWHLSTVSLS